MDPRVKDYLMQKYGQSWITPQQEQPSFNMTAPENLSPPQGPPQPNYVMADPNQLPPPMPEELPPELPPKRAVASKAKAPAPVEGPVDTSVTEDEMKRYGVRTPEELAELKKQRLQMGKDIESQANSNLLIKNLTRASDHINNTGNRIRNGNKSNDAEGVSKDLDHALLQKQEGIKAFDDANEKIGESDYKRIADIDNKREALQVRRDAAHEAEENRKVMREQTEAWRQSQHGDKLSKQDEDMQKKYGDSLDFSKASSRSPLGMAANNITRAKNVLGLLSKPVTASDRHLIANDLNTMVSGLANVTGAKAVEYNSLAAKAKDMANYLAGDAKNALPEAQRVHMQQQIQELYTNMANIIKGHKKMQDIKFRPVISRHPELAGDYDNQIEDMISMPKEAPQSAPMQLDHSALDAELKRRGL